MNDDQLTRSEELISVLYNLVSTTDQVQFMLTQEFANNVPSKGEGHTPVIGSPAYVRGKRINNTINRRGKRSTARGTFKGKE